MPACVPADLPACLRLLACSCDDTVQGEHHHRIGGGYARQQHTHRARSDEQRQLPTGVLLCGGCPPSRNVHHGHQHLQTQQGAESINRPNLAVMGKYFRLPLLETEMVFAIYRLFLR